MVKRIAAALVVLGLLVATVVGAGLLPTWKFEVGASSTAQGHRVSAKNLQLVCPGAALSSGGLGDTKVGQFAPIASAGVDFSGQVLQPAQLRQRLLTGASAAWGNLGNPANTQQLIGSQSAFTLQVQDPTGVLPQGSDLLAAQSFQLVKSASLNGLLAANCQRPTVEQWLIGANTTVGRESLLILANPNPTDASVSIELFGAAGKIQSGGSGQIAVGAFSTTVIPLAGLAPQEDALAVRVATSGATVASWVQQRTVRGLLAAGADLIAPAQTNQSAQVIAGLFKRGTKDATGLIAQNANYQDLTPQLALFVPGGSAAKVTAQVVSADPKVFGTVVQVTVQPGRPSLVPLTGLKDGNYSVLISSDQPLFSAVQLSRTNATKTPNTDFTWLPGQQAQAGLRVINVPKSGISKLSVVNPTDSPALVTITNLGSGKSQTITVGRQTSVATELDSGSVIAVKSQSAIASALVVDIDWQLAALALTDYRNLGGLVQVTLR